MEPRPHQLEALEAIRNMTGDRGKVIMACGTGKSLVTLWAAQESGAQRIVVFVPSLALIQQLLHTYREQASWPQWSAIAVCSDKSVAKDDGLSVDVSEIECTVTTKADDVANFMQEEGTRVVFCTYQSALLLAGMKFELGIFDEAHKTAGVNDKVFSFALKDESVQIDKRLFFTATPKVVKRKKDDWEAVYSMDDESVYGFTLYKLSYRRGVELGLICEYKILIVEVQDGVQAEGHSALRVAIAKSMQSHSIKKVFTFHRDVAQAKKFANSNIGAEGTTLLHVNGNMNSASRKEIMDAFSQASTAILSNARCLTEGVDVPAVDMTVFASPKGSIVDIVQAVGRASRKASRKNIGYVLIPFFRDIAGGETVEEAGERSGFDTIFQVLKAMATQDEALEATLKELRNERSDKADPLEPFLEWSGVDVDVLRRVIETRVMDVFEGPGLNKNEFIEMARRGLPKPKYSNDKFVYMKYLKYIHEDRDFLKEITSINPSWEHNFVGSIDDIQERNKNLIKESVLRGDKRPARGSKLSNLLNVYAILGGKQYDSQLRSFVDEHSDWFARRNSSHKIFEKLVAMAKTGGPTPKMGEDGSEERQIYKMFNNIKSYNYNGNHSDRYKTLLQLRPDWMGDTRNSIEKRVDATKEMLLDMAKRGEPRPSGKRNNLAHKLQNYLYKDHIFKNQLMQINKDWISK